MAKRYAEAADEFSRCYAEGGGTFALRGHAKALLLAGRPVEALLLHEESEGDMASDDRWSVATAEDNGKPLILRIRNKPPWYVRKEAFPHLLAVCWPYESPNDQGMPSQDVFERMSELESLLEPAFEGTQQAFLTVIVTGNGVREWQWYARDTEEVMKLVNETLGEHEPFPVHFSFQNDPEWQGYTRFLEITG